MKDRIFLSPAGSLDGVLCFVWVVMRQICREACAVHSQQQNTSCCPSTGELELVLCIRSCTQSRCVLLETRTHRSPCLQAGKLESVSCAVELEQSTLISFDVHPASTACSVHLCGFFDHRCAIRQESDCMIAHL